MQRQWIALALLLAAATSADGQGLTSQPQSLGASVQAQAALRKSYDAASKWRGLYRRQRATACSKQGASLCAGDASAFEAAITLEIAAAPAAYDVRSAPFPAKRLGTAYDQGECSLCVPAAVLAAAEAAAASALRVDAGSIKLSRSWLYYCGGGQDSNRRCASGWEIEPALNALKQLQEQQQLQATSCYAERGLTVAEASRMRDTFCDSKPCSGSSIAGKGVFRWRKLDSWWDAQDHLREHGAVITRMNLLYDAASGEYHLRRFYAARGPRTPYVTDGVPAGAKADGHAILLVGYDNTAETWLALNSWGPGFADGGVWVNPFGQSDIAPVPDLYGIEFIPSPDMPPRPLPTSPAPAGKSGACFVYTTQPGDFLTRIRHLFNVAVAQILLDNIDILVSVDEPLVPGTRLLVCGATRNLPDALGAGRFAAPRPPPLGAAPSKAGGASGSHLEMYRSLTPFDGRTLFIQHGPISKICVWVDGWIYALQVWYAGYASAPLGNPAALSGTQECISLAPGERITQVSAITGLFVDGFNVTITSASAGGGGAPARRSAKLGRVSDKNLATTMQSAPPGSAGLAAVSGWTGRWFYSTGASYSSMNGIQLDWLAPTKSR